MSEAPDSHSNQEANNAVYLPADSLAEESLESQSDPLIGTTIGERYSIISVLGRGGMGIVYRGYHIAMDKLVAIKMLSEDCIKDPVAKQRFQQEAQLASRLSHTNIVAIHDFGFAGGRPYIVMDLIEGQTLSQILDVGASISIDRTLELMIQICDGLAHAQQFGLIHRDLKASNIMVISTPDGNEVAKVLDFGLAKTMVPDGKLQTLTQSGVIVGTGLYMSPEQCRGKPADARSDIYALGCLMHEALTGLPPLVGENLLDTFQMHIEKIPEPMGVLRPDLDFPQNVQDIVTKALAKDPESRFQTARELKEELFKVKGPNANAGSAMLPESSLSPASTHRSRPMLWAALSAMALCTAAVLIFAGLWTKPAVSPLGSPHAQTTQQRWEESYGSAQIAFDKGQYGQSEKLLRVALPLAKQLAGNSQVLLTLHKLADTLYTQQKYDEADQIEKEIRRINNNQLSSRTQGYNSDAATAALINNAKLGDESQEDHLAVLAQVCHKQGQCDIAASLLERSVTISKRVYGQKSPQAAARMSELASFYIGLGMTEKAKPIIKQVMEIKGHQTPAPKSANSHDR